MKRRSMWRRNWPWLVGSLALHVVLLAALPGLDRDERCPVLLLVTLQAPAREVGRPSTAAGVNDSSEEAAAEGGPTRVPEPRPTPPSARQRPAPQREERSATTQPLLARSMQAPREHIPTTIQHVPRREPQPEPAEDTPVQETPTAEPSVETPVQPVQAQATTPVQVQPPTPPQTQAETPAPPVDVEALRRIYAQAARARIGAQQYVPDVARSAENSGRVVQVKVKVAIQPSGALGSVSLAAASGIPALDEAALNAVRRAAPFGAFPPELTAPQVLFVVPLQYTIR